MKQLFLVACHVPFLALALSAEDYWVGGRVAVFDEITASVVVEVHRRATTARLLLEAEEIEPVRETYSVSHTELPYFRRGAQVRARIIKPEGKGETVLEVWPPAAPEPLASPGAAVSSSPGRLPVALPRMLVTTAGGEWVNLQSLASDLTWWVVVTERPEVPRVVGSQVAGLREAAFRYGVPELKTVVVFDGNGVLSPSRLKAVGERYFSDNQNVTLVSADPARTGQVLAAFGGAWASPAHEAPVPVYSLAVATNAEGRPLFGRLGSRWHPDTVVQAFAYVLSAKGY